MQPIRPNSPPMNTPPPINPSGGSAAKLSSVSNCSDNKPQLGTISKVQNSHETQETGSTHGACALSRGEDLSPYDPKNPTRFLEAVRDIKLQNDKILKDMMAAPIQPSSPNTVIRNTAKLFTASRGGFSTSVDFLLSRDIDVNVKGPYQSTPLHHAAEKGHMDVVKLLIDKGANVHATDNKKMNPLHMAAKEGHNRVAKFLLDKGADVNASTSQGMSPLHFAAGKGHTVSVTTLLEHGADPKAKAKISFFNQPTPQKLAEGNGHKEVVSILKELNQPKSKDQ